MALCTLVFDLLPKIHKPMINSLTPGRLIVSGYGSPKGSIWIFLMCKLSYLQHTILSPAAWRLYGHIVCTKNSKYFMSLELKGKTWPQHLIAWNHPSGLDPYCYDILMIWQHREQPLTHFLEHVNLIHNTIHFAGEYSLKEINFLDNTPYLNVRGEVESTLCTNQ